MGFKEGCIRKTRAMRKTLEASLPEGVGSLENSLKWVGFQPGLISSSVLPNESSRRKQYLSSSEQLVGWNGSEALSVFCVCTLL